MIYKVRDLTIMQITDKYLVITCDSCGGIGNKPADILKVDPYYVGKYTLRVNLIEQLSINAKVLTIVNNVCNEMNSTGSQILKGIKDELADANVLITGSSEENFETFMTAAAVTAIGIVDKLPFYQVRPQDQVVLIGLPKVGDQINLDCDSEIVSYDDLSALHQLNNLIEIIPGGSKGILYECNEVAKLNNLKFINQSNIDLHKSCGPASCVIAIIRDFNLTDLENISSPINHIGYFSSNA